MSSECHISGNVEGVDGAVDGDVDVVIVGSGAGGMSAAITAAHAGLSVVLVEKSTRWGGTTARSGGGVWIPGNDVLVAQAPTDSLEDARRYLYEITAGRVDRRRLDAYIDSGPEALRFLCAVSSLTMEWVPGYSDYLPERPGGSAAGRSCEPRPFDVRALGEDFATMEPFYTETPMNVVVRQSDYKWLSTGLRHWRGPVKLISVAARAAASRIRRRRLVGLGGALVGGLMMGVRQAGVDVRLGCGFRDLVVSDGRVAGVHLTDGTTLRARRGVVLACGGFDHNSQMRAVFHRQPAGPELSLGVPTNTGDGIRAAVKLGAATDLMDDAWWAPSIPLPGGPWFALAERSLPHSIVVNGRGERFMNESLPYIEATHRMFGGEYGVGDGPAENLPAWLIFDQTYRNRYLFAGRPGRAELPRRWFDSGALTRADTLDELAAALGIPAEGLAATVARLNSHARCGKDPDFDRGRSAYDRYYGDITNTPNPSLGVLDRAPYYAARLVPADLGTKGGVLTDARARVLRADGSAIDGLYAVGNAAAALMGHTYAGPGATIGPALVFGYLAAIDLSETGFGNGGVTVDAGTR